MILYIILNAIYSTVYPVLEKRDLYLDSLTHWG